MVVQSADEGIANARKTTSNDVGMCLWYTQEWLKSPHVYPDATAQWNAAKYKHAGDRNPPAGAPVSWTGGSKGHGHSALSIGGGRIRTIDCTTSGKTTETDLGWVEKAWGLTYKGWHEDLGGVDIPYLRGGSKPSNPNKVEVGDVSYAIANGGLTARATPGGDATGTSLPYGSKITIAALQDGWAQAATADTSDKADAALVPVYSTGYLIGVDVSSNNANWQGLAADEQYCWVKSTEGRSYVNPDHDAQVAKIRAAGKVVGHYHWLVAGNTQEQLDYFFAESDLRPGDMIALDWEDSSRPPCSEKDQWITAARERADGANRVGLYCNRDWWLNMDSTSFYGDYLWIANYTDSSDPGVKADWLFWQYTSSPYDKNRGRFADLASLKLWAGGDDEPPPTPASGYWYSTDYLFTQIKPDPTNPNAIKNGDSVKVTASSALKARTLPGGPQSLDKNGDPLARAAGYTFTVTGELVDGWATGGTNWYSSDYLIKVTAPPVPTTPSWASKPTATLKMTGVPSPVNYLQAVMRVNAASGCSDGNDYAACYVMAQDPDNKGNTRFLKFTADGTYQSWMTVKGGGHGQTFHAYRSAGGNLWIWTLIGSVAYRILWQSSKTITTSSSNVIKQDYKGRRPVGTFEPKYVGFRSASDTKETFSIHDRFGFTDGSCSTAPLKEVTISKRTNYSQQSWTVSMERIYRIMGSTNSNPPKGSKLHIVDVFDWSGKLLLDRFDVTAMTVSGASSDEPEGLTFTGTPGSVLAGKRVGGNNSSRTYPVWQLSGLP